MPVVSGGEAVLPGLFEVVDRMFRVMRCSDL